MNCLNADTHDELKIWRKILAIVHFVINNLKFIRQRLNHIVKINTELTQDNDSLCINCGSQHHYATRDLIHWKKNWKV